MKDDQEIANSQASLARWVKDGKIEMSSTGLVVLDPDFSFDHYEELGWLLAGFHRSSCWWIGDWILFGEKAYGEMYAEAMAVTRLSEGTLMNYVSVCKRVPRSRRKIDLPFSVHAEIAPLPPAEQKHWLSVAAKDNLTQRELRQRLRPAEEGAKGEASPAPSKRVKPVLEDLPSLARSIVKQAVGDGQGRYLIPGELMVRLAATIGEGGFE